jgi:hypothetical protein
MVLWCYRQVPVGCASLSSPVGCYPTLALGIPLPRQDSCDKIDRIEGLLSAQPVDFVALDQLVHQFKGASASLGAHQVRLEGYGLEGYCEVRAMCCFRVSLA